MQQVVLPLSNKQLMDHLQVKNKNPNHYLIDYEKSILKGMGFLSYINNADLISNIINFDADIVYQYITYGSILSKNIPSLLHIHANLIMFQLTGDSMFTPEEFDYDQLLSDPKIMNIINEHIDLLTNIPSFILGNTVKNTELESDNDYNFSNVGLSWILLLSLPNFMDVCLSFMIQKGLINIDKKYPRNFNDYIFKGKNLTAYIDTNSLYYTTLMLQAQTYVS